MDIASLSSGGNFSFYDLGEPLLHGDVLNENVGVEKIREYVYFTDTKASLPESHPDEPYFMGVHIGSAYYFYYEKQAVTTLNREFLHTIKSKSCVTSPPTWTASTVEPICFPRGGNTVFPRMWPLASAEYHPIITLLNVHPMFA